MNGYEIQPDSTEIYLLVLLLGPLLGTAIGAGVVAERRSQARPERPLVQTPAPVPPAI
ncbi:MAG: hypothetical protein ACLP01_32385 [Solirubrobacteraceae bacterium]